MTKDRRFTADTLDEDFSTLESVCGALRAMCCLSEWQKSATLQPMSTTFDIDVRAALERRRGDWKRIAKDSGVSYSWLSKFANHKIANPGFDTLKAVHAVTTAAASPAAATAAPETAGSV